ncbi:MULTISPECIES: hypothetical protein, partial [unclassified Wolbachia]|uniref:hypothetical protein n=1 Tax=unclassified Wolbachia TaxID=2640676 RepID=UPI001304C9D8
KDNYRNKWVSCQCVTLVSIQKGVIPVSATFMTSFTMCHIVMFVQLWNESRYDVLLGSAIV